MKCVVTHTCRTESARGEQEPRAQEARSRRWETDNRRSWSLITNTKAKIDKDTETCFFGKSHPLGHLEESVCGSCRELRKGRGMVAASHHGQWPAETHLESFGTESVLPWPSDQRPGERSERQDSGLGRCRAEHVPGETCPLQIPGQVNPGAGNEMIKGIRDCVFQSKNAEHNN